MKGFRRNARTLKRREGRAPGQQDALSSNVRR